MRSRTPTDDLDQRSKAPHLRPKTPTEGRTVDGSGEGPYRSKTPTHDMRPTGRSPLVDMQNRRDYVPGGTYGPEDPRGGGYYDHDGRLEHGIHGHNGSRASNHGDRTDGEPRREYRSRTPGPEFMRGTNVQDEYMRQRPQEIRSKTPTHEVHYAHHHNISGTPDFIPASRYLPPTTSSPASSHHGNPPVGTGSVSSGVGSYSQGSPARSNLQDAPYTRPNYDSSAPSRRDQRLGSEFSHPQYSGSKLNSSQTFSGPLNYGTGGGPNSQQNRSFDSYGSGYSGYQDRLPHTSPHMYPHEMDGARPRKQSTSFEHEEPAPTNLTRIPRGEKYPTDSPSSSLNRSRSPTRFGDEDSRYVDLTVFLKRHDSGFGFRIIGGTEEGSQVSFGNK